MQRVLEIRVMVEAESGAQSIDDVIDWVEGAIVDTISSEGWSVIEDIQISSRPTYPMERQRIKAAKKGGCR